MTDAVLRRGILAAGAAAAIPAPASAQGQGALAAFLAALASRRIEIIDLTQTLHPGTPVIQLPPPLANTEPFRMSEISRYDARGPAWYWNNFSCGEHTGTHFDAPIHWVTGRDLPDGATDTLPPARMIAPACVIDCSAQAAADERFVFEPRHILEWESRHGRIPAGSWVLMRTDWSKRSDPAAFLNMRADGPHVPGPSAAAVRLLVERDVNGWGVEAVGTDHGQAFSFEPPFPAHALLHGANKYGLASLTNLDRLPPTGAALITPPLKIRGGSGSPLRVLALVER
ncbi:MAG: cyclase family protein [Acetobacteraceae bacterium]|nr:cyclase family protein [Acetobacteraceae bacterium]MCX7684850.1 cyclase family protein [Acetobacteraceae bacterium]MDW8397554.1 cyclase family protein [Acetobacteraceae bacterium]